mmetsp:Transcript_103533/g.298186  ORF Transcript_103533/g.298186 Transcript_103533/m.298186 type:complete len:237 (+) Transcript_103533:26-736(+)
MGPKPKAKLNTKKKALIAMTQPALWFDTTQAASPSSAVSSCVTKSRPIKPMREHATVMPTELHNINERRPARSASMTAGKVERKLTRLLIVVNKFLLKPMDSKICGPKYMKAFMPTSCCKLWSKMPKTSKRATRPLKRSDQAGSSSSLDLSSSWKISSSSLTASASSRMVFKTARASLRRFCCTSHLGERGRNNMPTRRKSAGKQMMPMTTRQPSCLSTMTWSMKAASKMPKVMPN